MLNKDGLPDRLPNGSVDRVSMISFKYVTNSNDPRTSLLAHAIAHCGAVHDLSLLMMSDWLLSVRNGWVHGLAIVTRYLLQFTHEPLIPWNGVRRL